MDGCNRCGSQGNSVTWDKFFIADLCHSCKEDAHGGLTIPAQCTSCGADFWDDTLEQVPFCRHCSFTNKQMMEQMDARNPKMEVMCVDKAIRLFVEARQNEDRETTRLRAFATIRQMGINTSYARYIKNLAEEHNLYYTVVMDSLAEVNKTSQAVEELLEFHNKQAYLAYKARENDKVFNQINIRSKNDEGYLDDYLSSIKMTICLYADDPFSDLPF